MGTWVGQTAAMIAAAVRDGTATPQQVGHEHLEQIERLAPEVGALRPDPPGAVRGRDLGALPANAHLASLPLAGVPVAIKDNDRRLLVERASICCARPARRRGNAEPRRSRRTSVSSYLVYPDV